MSKSTQGRKFKTERLQRFLHSFFDEEEVNVEKEVNGFLLVKFVPDERFPGGDGKTSRVELYELPLDTWHGRW